MGILHRLGWGSLCLGMAALPSAHSRWYTSAADEHLHIFTAGGVSYYFAKKSINADRKSRLEERLKKKSMVESLENSQNGSSRAGAAEDLNGSPARIDTAGSPSQESSSDPAPTRHAPTTEAERVAEKSKYESTTPFRSPKGDRFS